MSTQTGTTDITGIPVNFGCNQDYMAFKICLKVWDMVDDFSCLSLLAAIRAISEFLLQNLTAKFTIIFIFRFPRSRALMDMVCFPVFTPVAHKKRFTLFDSNNWDEKQTQITVRPL